MKTGGVATASGSGSRSHSKRERTSWAPLALGDVRQRQQQALPLDAHGDEPDALPGVEPGVQKLQLGLGGGEVEEAEGGVEEKPAAVVRHLMFAHRPPRLPRPRPACAS